MCLTRPPLSSAHCSPCLPQVLSAPLDSTALRLVERPFLPPSLLRGHCAPPRSLLPLFLLPRGLGSPLGKPAPLTHAQASEWGALLLLLEPPSRSHPQPLCQGSGRPRQHPPLPGHHLRDCILTSASLHCSPPYHLGRRHRGCVSLCADAVAEEGRPHHHSRLSSFGRPHSISSQLSLHLFPSKPLHDQSL